MSESAVSSSSSSSSPPPPPPRPSNGLVTALLTDLYQITMTYAHWFNRRHNDDAVFELFFRKNPFGGEFTIFCGLDEVMKHLSNFVFTESDVEYLRSTPSLSHCPDEFWTYLRNLDCSEISVEAMREGTVCFPRVPLIVIRGPLGIGQLLETTLLTLVNYPSLIATNAARMVLASRVQYDRLTKTDGAAATTTTTTTTTSEQDDRNDDDQNGSPPQKETRRRLPKQCMKRPVCVEFGLRRAQGPDGGFSASKYSHVGGFSGTSNVQAGKLLHLKIAGTHAHAFVQAYSSLDEVSNLILRPAPVAVAAAEPADDGAGNDDDRDDANTSLLDLVLTKRREEVEAGRGDQYLATNDGELAAFIAYACAFPNSFLCLIDTYDTIRSGLLNFCLVAMVLMDLGYTPRGIRLDSGDLASLSMECAHQFAKVASIEATTTSASVASSTAMYPYRAFETFDIVASNDINETTLHELNERGHAITIFGIGTNLVTCQKQPALGCVYKLVQLNGKARIKLSQEIEKVLIPGLKRPYRLYGSTNVDVPLCDVMVAETESVPRPHARLLCRHPFEGRDRVAVTPARVRPLHGTVMRNGTPVADPPPAPSFLPPSDLDETRAYVSDQLRSIPSSVLDLVRPSPYRVTVTNHLFDFLHQMWQAETPVPEIS